MTIADYRETIGDRTRAYLAAKEITGGHRVLYPGSYLDTAPLGAWPDVTFVDNDRKYAKFVAQLREPIPGARFLVADYREPIEGVPDGDAQVLISLYAGPISLHCTSYLALGGYLLANNSHGDASLAMLDPRFQLVAVLPTWRAARFRTRELTPFARAIKPETHTVHHVLASGRGVAFEKPAACYLFHRLKP